ncbi:MAG: glycosyltransferase [Patescibacteria group bacterium]
MFFKKQNYSFDWKIVLLLNGTHDQSESIAFNLKNKNKEIEIFSLPEKGKGNALKKYFNYSSASFLIYMDVDLAVSEDDYDLIIGSRLLKSSQTNRSLLREISSRTYIYLSKLIIKHPFSDLQCGFKGIKKEAWKQISPLILDKYWFFDTELLIFTSRFNFKFKEIPVSWSENRYEKRKTKVKVIRDTWKFIKNLIRLRKRLLKEDIF